MKQRLDACRSFLSNFGDFESASLLDCLHFIDYKLNVNLYDLLHWLRNPDTTPMPQRFPNVTSLGIYSYEANKVFPRFRASDTYIASPLLRSIGFYARPHVGFATECDWEEAASGQSENAEFTEESPKATEDVVGGEMSSITADNEPTQGTGASLFNIPESTTQQHAARKTNRFARKRRGAISAPKGMTARQAGNTVPVAA